MTTRDFIKNTFGVTANKERRCSSVFTDYDGNVYSYGYHYPLLFSINGVDFINTQGYSNTTAKHINWAWSAVDYKAIPVKLWRDDSSIISRSYATPQEKLRAVLTALHREKDKLVDAMVERQMKNRTNTAIYRDLASQLEQLNLSIEGLK